MYFDREDGKQPVEKIEPTAFQDRVLTIPEAYNLLMAGGRGGGKSECVKYLAIKHCEKYGKRAKVLYVRETWEAIGEFEDELAMLLSNVYGKSVGHHKTDHEFTWPSGAKIKLSQLADEKDYAKFQGKSFTMVVCDEYGNISNTKYVWLLVSNMRAKEGIPCRLVLLANPGGAQHGHIHFDFIEKAPAWHPFDRDGSTWVMAPSTLLDNPHIDRVAYVRSLRQACGNDTELLKAWLAGDWKIARGAYFAGSLDSNVHMLPVAPPQENGKPLISADLLLPLSKIWRPYIMHDWGSGSPSATYIGGISPGIGRFPKGSLLLVDELATCDQNALNVGLNWNPDKLADGIKAMCHPWGVFPAGVGDDAAGLDDTLLRTLARLGIFMRRPDKERVAGWQQMRRMLDAAKNRTGQPGLWISERCEYFWKTVPYLQRDPKHPEDIITKNVPDHGADAVRYGCMALGRGVKSGSTEGV